MAPVGQGAHLGELLPGGDVHGQPVPGEEVVAVVVDDQRGVGVEGVEPAVLAVRRGPRGQQIGSETGHGGDVAGQIAQQPLGDVAAQHPGKAADLEPHQVRDPAPGHGLREQLGDEVGGAGPVLPDFVVDS